jgi:hypothetical protein
MDETTSMEQWARLLPDATLIVSDPNTVLPIREITALLRNPVLSGFTRKLRVVVTWRRLRAPISSIRLCSRFCDNGLVTIALRRCKRQNECS